MIVTDRGKEESEGRKKKIFAAFEREAVDNVTLVCLTALASLGPVGRANHVPRITPI